MKFIDPDGHGEKLSYIKSNPNPVKGSTNVLIVGLFIAFAAFVLLTSIMFPALIPAWLHILAFASPLFASILFDDEGTTWGEDIDNDGYFETIVENELPNGGLVRTVIEEDGTMYMTHFSPSGEVINKWKTVPPEKEDEEPKNYVWDEKTKEWLPDQDMDGIPDTFEKPPG